jgi:hypothetical protein
VLADGSINVGSETLMSRGPGKIQRAVMAVFEAEPENGLLLSELCERVYRGINRVEKKHRVAVARAAHGIPWLAHMKRDTLGGELVFYNPASVVAYGMARMKGDKFCGYERNTDSRFSWRQPKSENDLRESLRPEGINFKYIVEGGAWRRFAALEHAKLIGDIATCEHLEREQKGEMDKLTEEVRAAFAGMPGRPQRPPRPPIVGYRLVWKQDGKWHKQGFASRRAANKVARTMGDRFFIIERVYGGCNISPQQQAGPLGDSLDDFARKRSPIACVPPLTTPKKGAYVKSELTDWVPPSH